jgi:hypothetical protein
LKLVQESSVNMMEKLVKIEDSTSKCDSEHYRTKYKVVTNRQHILVSMLSRRQRHLGLE